MFSRSLWEATQKALRSQQANQQACEKKIPPTLFIVDMQDDFPDSFGVEDAVRQHILDAKQNQAAIVVVEFTDHGHTHASLMAALAGYKHKIVVQKKLNDGSPQVIEGCLDLQCNILQMQGCGGNVNYCLIETATGLLKLLGTSSAVQIFTDACYQSLYPHKQTARRAELPRWRAYSDSRIQLI